MSSAAVFLCSASSSDHSMEPLEQSVQFKSGAVYTGGVAKGGKTRCGRGTFSWPSGLHYTGEFVDNKRHGRGVQIWPDGSRYEGGFKEDSRHGRGRHVWQNGEEYEGEYSCDKKHGHGRYSWPSGAHFCGHFDNDRREEAGVYVSPEGEKFEGVYHQDMRDGEGVLTYPGGRQDVGVWKGVKLVRLRFTVGGAFFDPSSANPLGSPNSSLGASDCRSRGNFGPKGPLEMISEELLQASAEGNVAKVDAILKSGAVHVDVVDRAGHSALFTAAIHCQTSVIHVLLDGGADVNLLDDSGISALNACYHVEYAAVPEVRALLSQLPSFPALSRCSSPSTFTERTLHTCDLFSTPGTCEVSSQLCLPQAMRKSTSQLNTCSSNVLSDHRSSQTLSPGDKGPLKSRSQGHLAANHQLAIATLPQVKSFPTLASSVDDERKVRFTRINGGSPQGQVSTGVNALHSEKAKDVREEVAMACLPLQPFAPLPGLAADDDVTLPRLEVESPLSSSDLGSIADAHHLPETASATGEEDILGVSALSGDLYSTSAPPEGESRLNVLSQLSNVLPDEFGDESLVSLSRQSETPPTPSLVGCAGGDCDEDPLPCPAAPVQYNNIALSSLDQLARRSSTSFSPQYGSIVSAAQSTSLSCAGSEDTDSGSSLNSPPSDIGRQLMPLHTPKDSISVLLMRGADPNICPTPLPPLFYAIRAGDLEAVELLLKNGASTEQWIPLEVRGHYPLHMAVGCLKTSSLDIVSSLLEHGADPDCEEQGTADDEHSTAILEEGGVRVTSRENKVKIEVVQGEENGIEEDMMDGHLQLGPAAAIAGENEGSAGYSPLHLICSTDTTSPAQSTGSMVEALLVAMVKLLVSHGAKVNRVAKGHSPLSLAILNGHDKVVDELLEEGADPNLPLGRGVGTALCIITTHTTLKKRGISSSLALVSLLIRYGADVFQSVRVAESAEPGTVSDFAHEAFKLDKRLAYLKYHSLTKLERSRYRAAKKLQQHFTNIFKCLALQTIAAKEESWLNMHKKEPTPYIELPTIGHQKIYRTTSMCDSSKYQQAEMRSPRKRNKGRSVISAGGKPRTRLGPLSVSLPEHTLRAALENVSKAHGNREAESDHSDEEQDGGAKQKPAGVKGDSRHNVMKLDEMFEKAKSLLPRIECSTKENLKEEELPGETGQKEWTMFSFCYECGRTSGVHLVKCPGCRGVSYCSRTCRSENWRRGHHKECTGAQVKLKEALAGKGRGGPSHKSIKRANTSLSLS